MSMEQQSDPRTPEEIAADESLPEEIRKQAVSKIANPEIRKIWCGKLSAHVWEYQQPETIDDYYADDDCEYRCTCCGEIKYEPRYKPSKYLKNINWGHLRN